MCNRPIGRIKARAESFGRNALRPREVPKDEEGKSEKKAWTENDKRTYAQSGIGDPVRRIRQLDIDLDAKGRHITIGNAGKILFEHWPSVFNHGARDTPMTIAEANRVLPARSTPDTPAYAADFLHATFQCG